MTKTALGKGHTGYFRYVPNRSWKIGTRQRSLPLCSQRCAVQWDKPLEQKISGCSSPRVPSLEYLYYKSEFLTVSVYFKADDWTRYQEHTFHNRLRKLCLLADNDTRLIYETVVEF